MRPDATDIFALTALSSLVLFPAITRGLTQRMMSIWQNIISFQRSHPLPLHSDVETVLLAAGSVIFFMSKVRGFRKNDQDSDENLLFMFTAVLGMGLGLFVDPDR